MLSKLLQLISATLCCAVLAAQTGCECPSKACVTQAKAPCVTTARGLCDRQPGEIAAELPPSAKPGECWAKVWIPPTFKTVSERVCIREASERLEVVPAKYETVEERILVKDASTTLEIEPAEFATREQTIRVDPGYTDWEINKACKSKATAPVSDVFCLVSHPPTEKTIRTECLAKPAKVKEVCIPAQYETVNREKLVCPATTRRISIPAEYETVDKTIKVCDGRMAWQRVICDRETGTVTKAPDEPTTIETVKVPAAKVDTSTATASAQRKHRR